MENSQQTEKLQELMSQSQQQNNVSGGQGDLSSLKLPNSTGGKRKRSYKKSKKHYKKGGNSHKTMGGKKSRRYRKSSKKHNK